MSARRKLEWYGDEDDRVGWPLCEKCSAQMADPMLVHAAASVGIEHGKSTGQMVREYIESFHAQGHAS